jgi:two-component system, NtrC family, response regulator AtoC
MEQRQPGGVVAASISLCSRIIGQSSAIQKIRLKIATVAQTDIPVLVTGESGTGKELVAQSLHFLSKRRNPELVSINCSAIPDALLESELFGYERGAFTGALTKHDGAIFQANHGTLLLDEIAELTAASQAKILRVCEERQVRRVGAVRAEAVDVRFVAATHGDLFALVRQGAFREDLLYRLNVINIHLPALRERREDIAELAETFLNEFGVKYGLHKTLSPKAIDYLQSQMWPGNVRELRNTMQRACILSDSDVLRPEDLIPISAALQAHQPMRQIVAQGSAPMKTRTSASPGVSERESLREALSATQWNKTKAAQLLAWSRMKIYRKINEYELHPPAEARAAAACGPSSC